MDLSSGRWFSSPSHRSSRAKYWKQRTSRHTAIQSLSKSGRVFKHSITVRRSFTWVDFRDGNAYVTFAHYAANGGEPNHDPRWTTSLSSTGNGKRRQAWNYPEAVVSRLGQMSISRVEYLRATVVCSVPATITRGYTFSASQPRVPPLISKLSCPPQFRARASLSTRVTSQSSTASTAGNMKLSSGKRLRK